MGYGQPAAGSLLGIDALDRNPNRMVPEVIPADQNFLAWELARNAAREAGLLPDLQSGIQRDFALAAIAMADMSLVEQTPPATPTTPPTTPPRLRRTGDRRREGQGRQTRAAEEARAASPSPRTSCPRSSSARRSSTS